jgi:cytidylate kinase
MNPVVCIDGPSGSGKGTVAALLAQRLGWHCLDSGALYRLTGLASQRAGVDPSDAEAVAAIAANLPVEFRDGDVYLNGEEVSREIRSETAGNAASKVAALPPVRAALLDWQRNYARAPGLVADGRDMGTVVFPNAAVKIFLDASAEERGNRRYKQLIEKGMDVNLPDLVTEIRERDERDRNRSVAPLRPAPDALLIDSTGMSIEQVLERVAQEVQNKIPDASP